MIPYPNIRTIALIIIGSILVISTLYSQCNEPYGHCSTPMDVSLVSGEISNIELCTKLAEYETNVDATSIPLRTYWISLSEVTSESTISLQLNSIDLSFPILKIYTGTCGSLTEVFSVRGTEGTLSIERFPLEESTSYFLAIADNQNRVGTASLIIQNENRVAICNQAPTLEVISTSMGSPSAGPYLPGEQVEICYTIDGYVNLGCNYLQAIVPFFGSAWNPASFDIEGQPVEITRALTTQGRTNFTTANPICEGEPSGDWRWFPTGTITYNLSSENPLGLTRFDHIPPAWAFVNSFDPACFEFTDDCCTNPSQDPNLGYGDDNYPICSQGVDHNWSVCFVLEAFNPASPQSIDCSVTMKSISDGETGTFINKECKLDSPITHNASVSFCDPIDIDDIESQIMLCEDNTYTVNLPQIANASYWYQDADGQIITLDSYSFDIESTSTEDFEILLYASNGCVSHKTIQVSIMTPHDIEIIQYPEIACQGEEVTLRLEEKGRPLAANIEIVWNNSVNASSLITSTTSDIQTVSVASSGCDIELEYEIAFVPEATFAFVENEYKVCTKGSLSLDFETQGIYPLTIDLEDEYGQSYSIELEDENSSFELEVDKSAQYTIVSALESTGCKLAYQHDIAVVLQEVQIDLGEDVFLHCDELSVMLENQYEIHQDIYDYKWSDIDGNLLTTNATVDISLQGEFVLEMTHYQTGCIGVDTVSVLSPNTDIGLFLLTEDVISVQEGEAIALVADIEGDYEDLEKIYWMKESEILCNPCVEWKEIPDASARYSVVGVDMYGCEEVLEVEVLVREIVNKSVYVPNIFDRSAGQENSTFRVHTAEEGVEITSFVVSDRWGNIVHQLSSTTAAKDFRWDGTKKGQQIESGVYMYRLEIIHADGSEEQFVGSVVLWN